MLGLFLANEYQDVFTSHIYGASGGLGSLKQAINEVGSGAYHTAQRVAAFSCVISLVLIIIMRFIFRIASPREDARAKAFIQNTLLVTFILSIITELFTIVFEIAGAL